MLSTKDLFSISDVPESWIFEYYAGLSGSLLGEDITLKSLFKPNEKTPSMKIFYKDGRYFYKDFSSGNGGTAINLVEKVYGLTYGETISKIINDYKSYHGNGKIYIKQSFKPKDKTVVDSFEIKPWTQRDAKFWSKFNIGSKLLELYNVKPCDIILKKGDKIIDLRGRMIYGYFDSNGEIYKIYQPYNQDNKFLTFKSHIQGLDQLEYKHKYLVIVSSLKDGLSLNSLGLPVEFIAPASENTIIEPVVIDILKSKYQKIITILDNDDAGLRAMLKYNSLYNLPYANLDMSKDISDSVKDHGSQEVKLNLYSLLKSIIK
jgi:hypothetical protein